MTTSLVLTFIGHDRPGLVSSVAEKITASGGSWLDSRLARLAGEFAGIVLVGIPERNVTGLMAELARLEATGLKITAARSSVAPATTSFRIFDLQLIGHDRPGIVRDVTQAMSQLGANIEAFTSDIESAPFTGETMFRAAARLQVPDDVTAEEVRKTLEHLADEIMVDLTVGAGEGPD